MFAKKSVGLSLAALVALALSSPARAASGNACMAGGSNDSKAQKARKTGEVCDPHFTYTPGPHDPDHWGGDCNVGKVQSPINITGADRVQLPAVTPAYQAADLKIFNDCNHYQVKVFFPVNAWLRVGDTPYQLVELHFHQPGEHEVNGHQAAMVIHLVHQSPKAGTLVIEVPIEVGQQSNATIQTILDHVPPKGDESNFPGVKINVMDLLPADRDYYHLPGSLTTPECRQGITWMVLKHPITITQTQLDEYKTHYFNTARPLQPANGRRIEEPIR